MAQDKNAAKKVLTPKFRASFPHVFEAHSFEGQAAKFSIAMLFDKQTDITTLKKAVHAAATEKFGVDKAKWPKNLHLPFSNGDEKADLDGYEGTIVVRATSKNRPQVVDQKRNLIAKDDGLFYPGCYARATLQAFAYSKMGKNGVSFGLQNIQKVADGEPFGFRRNAKDEFEDIDDGSDNADSYAEDSSMELGF